MSVNDALSKLVRHDNGSITDFWTGIGLGQQIITDKFWTYVQNDISV